MRGRAIVKILGVLLMLFSVSMIPPIIVAYIYPDNPRSTRRRRRLRPV